ncbi:MAG: formylmethanofuran dehydrogenase subunit B [Archaeoglobaceae archaeon]|nr:formylmethanofuran dehydrogenase subunit B [Archaeoglobaceae archaeon]MDW8117901.1 formylmethanofuran dehydrogenase subunit B [Archaeoglobaceae archaeon]
MICTACSCLCDDIEISDGKVLHACERGYKHISRYKENRSKPLVEGKEVDLDKAIESAIEMIKSAKNLAIYGLDTSTVEAQRIAIKIADKLNCYIDDNSSFCLGEFVEAILKKEIPSTTLDDVKDRAYVLIYWGANPHQSLPRHMSRYTYYPRGAKRQRGYDEDRYLVVFDVRRTETAKLAKKNARFIQVQNDLELVDSFIKALEGKAGKFEVVSILREMKKAELNVVFGGLGLKYGLKGNFKTFIELIKKINEFAPLYFIPAGFHSNMRGFNETLFEAVKAVNSYSFSSATSSPQFTFTELLKNEKIDTALIVGTDPLASLPYEVSSKLSKVKKIVVDPRLSLTAKISEVVIPSAFSGIECSGEMVRSDGVRFKLSPISEAKTDDVYVLKRILEGF